MLTNWMGYARILADKSLVRRTTCDCRRCRMELILKFRSNRGKTPKCGWCAQAIKLGEYQAAVTWKPRQSETRRRMIMLTTHYHAECFYNSCRRWYRTRCPGRTPRFLVPEARGRGRPTNAEPYVYIKPKADVLLVTAKDIKRARAIDTNETKVVLVGKGRWVRESDGPLKFVEHAKRPTHRRAPQLIMAQGGASYTDVGRRG